MPGTRPIPRGFVGLSVEFTHLLKYTGTDPQHVNPVFESLLGSLAPGGAPSLRIGGVSTDHTWWPVRGRKRPTGVNFTLTRNWLAVAGAVVHDLGAQALLGINLEADQPWLAAAEARALSGSIGPANIAGFEIGNEPSNYSHFAYYRVKGRAVHGRPGTYGFPQFTANFATFAQTLRGFPIAGPALAGYGWLAHLGEFLRAVPSVSTVTFHRYPLNSCFPPPGAPDEATLPHLLAPFAASGFLDPAKPFVAMAHRHGARFRLDEFNSVSCSGKVGLSNIFASALWAVDTLFHVAQDGIDGVNVHTFPGASYAPFDVRRSGARWSATVHPEYYGLLMFARAAPAGSTLLRVTGGTPPGISVWATRAPDRSIRVVIVNKRTTRYDLGIALHGASATAAVQRLLAPGLQATSRVTLGGQAVATPSTTGALVGNASTETTTPQSGRYVLRVAPASAAMLTIAP